MADPVWDATVYSKNRELLLQGDVAGAFVREVLGVAKQHDLVGDERFTVDGTLIEARPGQKSIRGRFKTSSEARNPLIPKGPVVRPRRTLASGGSEARGGTGNGRRVFGIGAHHRGRRQELRHRRVGEANRGLGCHAARDTEQ
jgi:hypothetical protein